MSNENSTTNLIIVTLHKENVICAMLKPSFFGNPAQLYTMHTIHIDTDNVNGVGGREKPQGDTFSQFPHKS